MPYEIYRKGSMEDGEPIMTVGSGTLVGADLTDADLSGAYLKWADLRQADLTRSLMTGADLSGACLSWSHLTDADLTGADMCRSDLNRTRLCHANLTGANLTGADLTGANLKGADLTGTILPNGETLKQFVEHTVPRLLTAGGKPLEEVASSGNWACHSWRNCPIAVAFSTDRATDVPEEHRLNAVTFIALFDAGLIPRPVTTGDNQDAV